MGKFLMIALGVAVAIWWWNRGDEPAASSGKGELPASEVKWPGETDPAPPRAPKREAEPKRPGAARMSPLEQARALTAEKEVVAYVKAHGHLPAGYVTKSEALNRGWLAGDGNLCDVLPGHAIGGDYFGNHERRLPTAPGRTWREADLNYNCGTRGRDRLLYSSDGLVFVTHDHYKSFIKL